MSSSFQSTAATRIYDSPVDTFVQPVTAIQKSSMADLAEISEISKSDASKIITNLKSLRKKSRKK